MHVFVIINHDSFIKHYEGAMFFNQAKYLDLFVVTWILLYHYYWPRAIVNHAAVSLCNFNTKNDHKSIKFSSFSTLKQYFICNCSFNSICGIFNEYTTDLYTFSFSIQTSSLSTSEVFVILERHLITIFHEKLQFFLAIL